MDKIVVLGYQGMLGSYVYHYLNKQGYDVIGKGSQGPDLTLDGDPNLVIVNCAGAIPQRYGEQHKEIYYNLNVKLPRFLEQTGSKLIHISTDCVFSGRAGNYSEKDAPDPTSLYGASKFLGEPLGLFANCHTIRTSIIGDNKPYGLMGWYINKNASDIVDGYINHYWNGVTCLELAKEIERLIREGGPPLYHFHSPDRISKYILLNCIREVYGGPSVRRCVTDESIDRTLTSEYSFLAKPITKQLREMYHYGTV